MKYIRGIIGLCESESIRCPSNLNAQEVIKLKQLTKSCNQIVNLSGIIASNNDIIHIQEKIDDGMI